MTIQIETYAYSNSKKWDSVMNPTDEREMYCDILESICRDMACTKHRKVNNGALTTTIPSPSRPKKIPLDHVPNDDGEGKQEWYATDQPVLKRFRTMLELPNKLMLEEGDQGSVKETTETPVNDRVTRHQQNQTDIWGRIPAKEPKEMAFCSICRRHVSVVRFAPHLDKCMGIGTTTRIATTTTSKP